MTSDAQGDIKVAIVGHTNVGKTTFIRTLLRQPFGEIDDRSNVTEYAEPIHDKLLNVTFVDTPGFQKAGVLQAFRSAFRHAKGTAADWMGFRKALGDDGSLRFDERAAAAVADSDIVLYLASLSDVPDNAHADELALTREHQPCVIGIINQYAKSFWQGSEATHKRAALWRDMFKHVGVTTVLMFDSHWEKPSALLTLYESIRDHLPEEKAVVFANGLRDVRRHVTDRTVATTAFLADCVISCCELEIAADSEKFGYDESKTRADVRRKLLAAIEARLVVFARQAKDLYALDTNHPSAAADTLKVLMRESSNSRERLANAASGGAVGASIFALVGAGIGTLVLPGLGTAIGAAIGGGAGGVGGAAVGANKPINTHVVGVLDDADLQRVFEACLAISWAMSFQGFGRGARVPENTIAELRARVAAEARRRSKVTRLSTKEELMNNAVTALESLEAASPVHMS